MVIGEGKKKKELSNVTKVRSHLKLILPIVTMELTNVRKNKGITKCGKSIVKNDVGIA